MVQSHLPPSRNFRSPHICLCLSEDTLKAGGPFNLLSIPGEVKDPIQGGKCVTYSGLTNSRWTLNALLRARSSIWEKGERERKGNVEGYELNWGHNFGFYFLGDLNSARLDLYIAVTIVRLGHVLVEL